VEENLTETVRLLVVSRESALLRPLWSVAEPNSWHIDVAVSGWDAIERVQSGIAPHLLVLDLPRGDGDCLHILRWLRRLRPDLPVLVVCCAEDADRKREAMRLGAQEVLIRPFEEDQLESAICRYLTAQNSNAEVGSESIEQVGPDSFFVSASPVTQQLRAQIQLLAEADVPVLILGERGTGKDTVARLIHEHSVRSGFKFIKVNCADVPGELLEAELFETKKIPSSNDVSKSSTKFEHVEKGTIFLDEITEMPIGLQAKLVHRLQGNLLQRSANDNAASGGIRILAATSTNLERALAERKLREDLYYRLSAFSVHVPPLRSRASEIPVLLRHAMHHLAKQYGLAPRELPPTLIEACQHYSWPGNLKELENFVKRYLVAGDSELAFGDLEAGAANYVNKSHASNGSRGTTFHTSTNGKNENQDNSKSLKSLIQSVKTEAERNAIGTVLQKTGWNRKAAARLLQVSYRTLLYKIDQYHISTSESFLSPLVRVAQSSPASPAKSLDRPSRPIHENEWKALPRSKP